MYFNLDSHQLSRLCEGKDANTWQMLINNYALYVNEFHNKEGNPVYLIECDTIQFDLINYILEKTKRPPVMSLNTVNQVGDKNENPQNSDKLLIQGHCKKNNFIENVEISKLANEENIEQRTHSIQVITNSLYEFIFDFNDTDLRIEISKGDIFDQIADVLVYSANKTLQLSCKLFSSFK